MRPMHQTRRHRRAAALVAVAALALGAAACSDDEDPIDPDEDEEVIDDAIVTLDDLPEGFEENEPDDDDDENDECFEEVGIDVDELDDAKVFEGETADFQFITDEALVGVTAQITSFSDADLAEESLEAAASDEFIDCVVDGVQSSAEEDGEEVGDVSAEVIDSPVDGDAATSVRVQFEAQGFPTTVEQHLVLAGRFGISLQVFSLGEDVDGELAEDLLETMIERIEDATEG